MLVRWMRVPLKVCTSHRRTITTNHQYGRVSTTATGDLRKAVAQQVSHKHNYHNGDNRRMQRNKHRYNQCKHNCQCNRPKEITTHTECSTEASRRHTAICLVSYMAASKALPAVTAMRTIRHPPHKQERFNLCRLSWQEPRARCHGWQILGSQRTTTTVKQAQ